MWWGGFLTDYKTTPTKVVLSCFGLLVGLWQYLVIRCMKKILPIQTNKQFQSTFLLFVGFYLQSVMQFKLGRQRNRVSLIVIPGLSAAHLGRVLQAGFAKRKMQTYSV